MRAKRLNAEKVTITMDSDLLLSAKHKALDNRLTLSDYIQHLVKCDVVSIPIPTVPTTEEPISQPLGMDIFADLTPAPVAPQIIKLTIDKPVAPKTEQPKKVSAPSYQVFQRLPEVDRQILSLRKEGCSYQKIADILNARELKNVTGNGFNKNVVNRRYDKLVELEEA